MYLKQACLSTSTSFIPSCHQMEKILVRANNYRSIENEVETTTLHVSFYDLL